MLLYRGTRISCNSAVKLCSELPVDKLLSENQTELKIQLYYS